MAGKNNTSGKAKPDGTSNPEATEPIAAPGQDAAPGNGTAEEPNADGQTKPTDGTDGDIPAGKTGNVPKVSDIVKQIGQAILESNPEMSVVYMTADGHGFYEKNDAHNHAKTLTNQVVTPVKR